MSMFVLFVSAVILFEVQLFHSYGRREQIFQNINPSRPNIGQREKRPS